MSVLKKNALLLNKIIIQSRAGFEKLPDLSNDMSRLNFCVCCLVFCASFICKYESGVEAKAIRSTIDDMVSGVLLRCQEVIISCPCLTFEDRENIAESLEVSYVSQYAHLACALCTRVTVTTSSYDWNSVVLHLNPCEAHSYSAEYLKKCVQLDEICGTNDIRNKLLCDATDKNTFRRANIEGEQSFDALCRQEPVPYLPISFFLR